MKSNLAFAGLGVVLAFIHPSPARAQLDATVVCQSGRTDGKIIKPLTTLVRSGSAEVVYCVRQYRYKPADYTFAQGYVQSPTRVEIVYNGQIEYATGEIQPIPCQAQTALPGRFASVFESWGPDGDHFHSGLVVSRVSVTILTSAPRLEASQIENACRGKLGPNDVPSEGGRSVLLTGPTRPTGSSATPPDSPPTSTSTAPSAPTPTPPASTFTPEQAEAGAKLLGSFADNISRDVGDGPFGGTNDLGFGVASLYSQRTSASPKAQQINAMGAHWAFSALAGGDKIFAAEIGASLDFVMGWSKLANNQDNGIVIFGTQPRFAFYAGPLGVGMRSNVDWMTTQVEGANAVSHFDFGPEVTLANNNSKRYRVSVSGFVMQPQWRSETWREDLTKNLFQSRTDRTSGFEARLTMQHITVTADIRLRDLRNLPGFPQLFNRQVYLGLGYRE